MQENESVEKQQRIDDAVRDFQKRNFEEKYIGASFSKLQLPEGGSKNVGEFTIKSKNFLVYLGRPGCGKTWFCSAFAEWSFMRFNSRRYYTEDQMLDVLREGFQEGDGAYLKNLHRRIDDELIILDDIGAWVDADEKGNAEAPQNKNKLDWRRDVLMNFIDERYRSNKPTVLTSNLNYTSFKKIYGERVVSRIFAAENIVIQNFDGPDLRQLGF